jgi:phosphatidylglycerophosphatase A
MSGKSGVPRLSLRTLALSDPLHFVAAGFGAGLAPRAPGTAGTLVAVPLYLLLRNLSAHYYVAVAALLFAVGVAICARTADALNVHDHPGIVFDEVVGFLVAMTAAPQGWAWLAAGFVLFRFFDIVKPPPIGMLDRRVRGGLGIMLDDLVAGVFAAIVLQGLAWLTRTF